MPAADLSPACPVCGLPVTPAPDCTECGWRLQEPPRLGPVTPQLRQEFAERLSARQHALDVRAAALVSADPAACQEFVRGGAPGSAEWADGQRAAGQAQAQGLTEESLRGTLREALRGAPAGAVTTAAVVDPEGITVLGVVVDEFGSPTILPSQQSTAWVDVLPLLSGRPAERRFQLAGATQLDRARLEEQLSQNLPTLASPDPLVISWPIGWKVLDRAAALFGSAKPRARLIQLGGDAAKSAPELVASLAASMPLLRGYSLVVAVADPNTGKVTIQTRNLFSPGDRPGTQCELSLRRAPGGQPEVALAVVAGAADTNPLCLYSARLPPGPTYRVRVRLEGPGRIEFTQPSGATPLARTWRAVRAEVPERLDRPLGPIDLVCALELAGPYGLVSQRRCLIRELLDSLAAQQLGLEQLRVALLGCTDHVYRPGMEKRSVVRVEPFADVDTALTALADLDGDAVTYPYAAPLEDLLHEAAQLLSGSRALGRTPRLVLVGGRPPHPSAQGASMVLPCPLRRNWPQLLRQLTGSIGAVCVAVADASPPKGAPRGPLWRGFGQAAPHRIDTVSAQQVGEDLGLLIRENQRIPIPLAP